MSFRSVCCSEVTAISTNAGIQTRDDLGVITSGTGMTMKKVLLVTASLIAISATAPALAADLAARPYTKAPPMVAAIYDWSGFYVGANGGWGSSRNCWNDAVDGATGV